MYSNIQISLKYNSNFTPKYKNLDNYIIKKNSKIFCKNFFFFFLILEYFYLKKTINKVIFKIFCLGIKKKKLTFLRSPNRAKSSQVNLTIPRYIILFKLKFNYNQNIFIKNKKQLIHYICVLNNNFNFFESNILNLISIKINLHYKYRFTL